MLISPSDFIRQQQVFNSIYDYEDKVNTVQVWQWCDYISNKGSK